MTSSEAKEILQDIFPKCDVREIPGNPNIIGAFLFTAGLMTYMVMEKGLVVNCYTQEIIAGVPEQKSIFDE